MPIGCGAKPSGTKACGEPPSTTSRAWASWSAAEDAAGDLSHGEHRQLEIAMALATRPRLLLLDEPMAGMGPEESARMVSTLRDLRRERTLLLVEHDMDAVFAIADRITVLVSGRVVASGRPEAIRADPEVRRAYLGEDFPDAAGANGKGMADGTRQSDG